MPRARAHARAAQQAAEAEVLQIGCPAEMADPADSDSEDSRGVGNSSLEDYAESDWDAVAEDSQEASAIAEDLFGPSSSDQSEPEAAAESSPVEEAPPQETYSSADCSLVADISAEGHVTCPLPPWNASGRIGCLTDWPPHQPPEKRSMSMKCFLHRGKCAVVRTRRKVSEDMMLRWLFSAQIPPKDCSKEEMAKLVRAHKEIWLQIVAEPQP